ncbi:MAG: hypothetical protein KDA25_12930 [Phycisphaerales bacterium]|nr:hypothetical protein [Phycisphaerales bacterium]
MTATASAGIPALELIWEVDGNVVNQFNPGGSDVGGGLFNYQGQLIDGGGEWQLSWNLNAKPDPLLSGNIAVENFTNATHTFALTILLPTIAIPDGTFIGGSVAAGLTTDANGGTLSTVGNNPLWTALMDGVAVESLLDAPFSLTNPGIGSMGDQESFGLGVGGPEQPGPALVGQMGIRIEFSLTGGDQFTATSVFAVVVPAPAALAMFGVAGLVGRRRRRLA